MQPLRTPFTPCSRLPLQVRNCAKWKSAWEASGLNCEKMSPATVKTTVRPFPPLQSRAITFEASSKDRKRPHQDKARSTDLDREECPWRCPCSSRTRCLQNVSAAFLALTATLTPRLVGCQSGISAARGPGYCRSSLYRHIRRNRLMGTIVVAVYRGLCHRPATLLLLSP